MQIYIIFYVLNVYVHSRSWWL